MAPWPYDLTAAFYDLDMAPNADARDLPWYLAQARTCVAAAGGGPVLELGCGTGRLTLPLAAAGLDMVGTDRSHPMLQVLRGKAAAAGLHDRVALHLHDMQQPPLPVAGCAAVLCPYSAFAYLVDPPAARRMLDAAAAALKPGGLLLMDLYVPDPALAALPPGTWIDDYRRPLDPTRWNGAVALARSKVVAMGVQGGVNRIDRRYRFVGGDGRVLHEVQTSSLQRPYAPQALRACLEAAGLDIVQACGDFDPGVAPRWPARTLAVAARPRAAGAATRS